MLFKLFFLKIEPNEEPAEARSSTRLKVYAHTKGGECMYVLNSTYKRQPGNLQKYLLDCAMLTLANVILATGK